MLSTLFSPLQRAVKRRRGGWRQQVAAEDTDDEQGPPRMSRLVGEQFLKWADGTISAAGLAETCADAIQDGLVTLCCSDFLEFVLISTPMQAS